MKKQAILYWLPHALLLLLMMGSGIMYFIKPEDAAKAFVDLGYPAYTMYFNATAKLLGGIAILVPSVPRFLKEWAYAGYLYILLLATQAIAIMMPESLVVMIVALAIWGLAYWQFRKRS